MKINWCFIDVFFSTQPEKKIWNEFLLLLSELALPANHISPLAYDF